MALEYQAGNGGIYIHQLLTILENGNDQSSSSFPIRLVPSPFARSNRRNVIGCCPSSHASASQRSCEGIFVLFEHSATVQTRI